MNAATLAENAHELTGSREWVEAGDGTVLQRIWTVHCAKGMLKDNVEGDSICRRSLIKQPRVFPTS